MKRDPDLKNYPFVRLSRILAAEREDRELWLFLPKLGRRGVLATAHQLGDWRRSVVPTALVTVKLWVTRTLQSSDSAKLICFAMVC